jgi:hypothetical protein
VSYELVVQRAEDGSFSLVGDAPGLIRISVELLNSADPTLVKLNDRGDVMFSLTNAVLWYRRVGQIDADARVIEFERVA